MSPSDLLNQIIGPPPEFLVFDCRAFIKEVMGTPLLEIVQKPDWPDLLSSLYELMTENEHGQLQYIANFLKKKLTEADRSEIPSATLKQLESVVLALDFFNFYLLEDKERAYYIKSAIVSFSKLGLDVKEALNQTFDFYRDPFHDFSNRLAALEALRVNTEMIGVQTVTVWLANYLSSVTDEKSRGPLSIINFLNTNLEARKLAKDNKEILVKVLSLYDWLEFLEIGAVEEKPLPVRPAPAAPPRVVPSPVVTPPTPKPVTLLDDVLGKITRGELDKKKLIAYLKVVLPKPIDFKKVLGLVNELKRSGFPEFMELVYFDPADGQYHWTE